MYEQFIVTDIDNYLVYSKADSYFKQFGELFIKYLMDLGYPPVKTAIRQIDFNYRLTTSQRF